MKDRVSFCQLRHVFKVKTGKAPSYISEHFTPVSTLHSHSTRNSHAHNYFISPLISQMPSSFVYTAVKTWNGLSLDIKSAVSEHAFKRKLKADFLSRYQ